MRACLCHWGVNGSNLELKCLPVLFILLPFSYSIRAASARLQKLCRGWQTTLLTRKYEDKEGKAKRWVLACCWTAATGFKVLLNLAQVFNLSFPVAVVLHSPQVLELIGAVISWTGLISCCWRPLESGNEKWIAVERFGLVLFIEQVRWIMKIISWAPGDVTVEPLKCCAQGMPLAAEHCECMDHTLVGSRWVLGTLWSISLRRLCPSQPVMLALDPDPHLCWGAGGWMELMVSHREMWQQQPSVPVNPHCAQHQHLLPAGAGLHEQDLLHSWNSSWRLPVLLSCWCGCQGDANF